MDAEDLEKKITEWMAKQSAETLVCFQCKEQPSFVYFPEDFSWGPVLICKVCRDCFDSAVSSVGPGLH